MGERGTPEIRPEEGAVGRAPGKILLATDGSRGSELAARTAADLTRRFGSGLHLVHVMPVTSLYSGVGLEEEDALTIYEEDADRARKLLDEQAVRFETDGIVVEKVHLRTGEPGAEIVALAEELGADLVVVGSRGTGALKRAPMGRVSESVVRHAHCPVLVVREGEARDGGGRF